MDKRAPAKAGARFVDRERGERALGVNAAGFVGLGNAPNRQHVRRLP